MYYKAFPKQRKLIIINTIRVSLGECRWYIYFQQERAGWRWGICTNKLMTDLVAVQTTPFHREVQGSASSSILQLSNTQPGPSAVAAAVACHWRRSSWSAVTATPPATIFKIQVSVKGRKSFSQVILHGWKSDFLQNGRKSISQLAKTGRRSKQFFLRENYDRSSYLDSS